MTPDKCRELQNRAKQQDVQAESHTPRLDRSRAKRAVDREQDVVHRIGAQICRRGRATLPLQTEERREVRDGSGGTVASGSAQFEKVVRRGNGHQKSTSGTKDSPEFGSLHSRRDGKYDAEG